MATGWHKPVTLLLFCFLLLFQLYEVSAAPIWRDDAFLGSIAKNLLLGHGYSAVFFDANYPFHYGISTGPALILPLTLAVALFGNTYWVPGMTLIAIITLQLLLVFFLAKPLFRHDANRWRWACYSLFLLPLYSYQLTQNPDRPIFLWHNLMGELPAILWLVMGGVLLFTGRFFWAGLVLGIGLQTKFFILIAIAGMGPYVLWLLLRRVYPWRALLWLGIGLLLPRLCYEATQLYSLGFSQYAALLGKYAEFVTHNAVGAKEWMEKVDYLTNRSAASRFDAFLMMVGGPAFLFFIPCVLIIATQGKTVLREEPLAFRLAVSLLIGAVLHFAWWIGFSTGMSRHVQPVIIYCCFGLALLAAGAGHITSSKPFFLFFCLMLLLLGRQDAINYYYLGGYWQDGTRSRDEQEQVRRVLVEWQDKNHGTLFSCGNNFELEYLLPGSNHFRDCRTLPEHKGPALLVIDYPEPQIAPGKILFVYADGYFGQFEPVPIDIRKRCGEPLFGNTRFKIMLCRTP